MKYNYNYTKVVGTIERFVICVSVILMATILITNTITRTFFSFSLSFAEEVGQFLLIIMTFIGTSYAARTGQHIRMTAAYMLLPEKVKKILLTFMLFTTSLIMFVLSYISVQYVQKLYESMTLSIALRFPIYIIYIVVPIGLALTGIEYLRAGCKNIKEKELYISAENIDDLI